MSLLSAIVDWLVPTAHAVTLETAGFWNGSGISSMWVQICTTLPFCTIGAQAPAFVAAKIINGVFAVMTGVAVCVIIYAGIKMAIAQGEDDAVSDAKKILTYAISGLILALLGSAITTYVATFLVPQLLGS